MTNELETYELYVSITKNDDGTYEWGIGQELEFIEGEPEFQFVAGGEEDTLKEAVARVSEEIQTLF